jgi:hypothetical protein
MSDSSHSSARLRERLKWIASLLLAVSVVCCGCGFFITTGLVARGELTANILGTDFRLWSINSQQQTGLGLQRSYRVQREGRSCAHYDVSLFAWKPALALDNVSYDDCG